ncbi:MAG: hypothetical protein KAX49_17680 [Halanaerobiales bacterium]|nr:hypothetical protein [Halanaerobiales bacterium]
MEDDCGTYYGTDFSNLLFITVMDRVRIALLNKKRERIKTMIKEMSND